MLIKAHTPRIYSTCKHLNVMKQLSNSSWPPTVSTFNHHCVLIFLKERSRTKAHMKPGLKSYWCLFSMWTTPHSSHCNLNHHFNAKQFFCSWKQLSCSASVCHLCNKSFNRQYPWYAAFTPVPVFRNIWMKWMDTVCWIQIGLKHVLHN